jgi:two-component system response regulator PilR (NtrC family)
VASGIAPPRSLSEQLDVVERRLIREALARSRFNRTEAADSLGLTLRQLRYRMQRLHINEQE